MLPGFVVYIGLALLVGYFGKDRKFGLWGYFFASLIFTPLVGLIMALASDKKTVIAV